MHELSVTQYGQALTRSCDETLIQRYLRSLDVAPCSKQTYQKGVRRFVRWLEERGIESPIRADILAYKQELLLSYTTCTVSGYMTAVKSFYLFLEGEGLAVNIAAGIKGARHQEGFRKDALTAGQAARVLNSLDATTLTGARDFALVNLLLRTGLRGIEAQRANIEDMRGEAGEMLLYIQGKGRGGKDAFVVLTPVTLEPIREYLRMRGKLPDSAPLFVSHSDRNFGQRLTSRSISRIVKQALHAAGYDSARLSAHSLRHTAVTLSLLGGASIQEAQALARHRNINTTLIYAHNVNRIANAPERRIDSLLEDAL